MKVIIEDANGPAKEIVYSINLLKHEPEFVDMGDYRDMLEEIEKNIEDILRLAKRDEKMKRTKLDFNISIIYIEEHFNVGLPLTPGVCPLDCVTEILRIAKREKSNPFRFKSLSKKI